jgi:hypothetical protein
MLLHGLSVTGTDAAGKRVWGEPSVTVRDTAAWTMGKLLGFRFSIVDKSLLPQVVDVLCGALADKPRVANNVAYVRARWCTLCRPTFPHVAPVCLCVSVSVSVSLCVCVCVRVCCRVTLTAHRACLCPFPLGDSQPVRCSCKLGRARCADKLLAADLQGAASVPVAVRVSARQARHATHPSSLLGICTHTDKTNSGTPHLLAQRKQHFWRNSVESFVLLFLAALPQSRLGSERSAYKLLDLHL